MEFSWWENIWQIVRYSVWYMFCLSNRRRFLACIRQGWGGGLIWAYFVRESGWCRAFVFFFKSVGAASTRKIRCLQSCSSHPADSIFTEMISWSAKPPVTSWWFPFLSDLKTNDLQRLRRSWENACRDTLVTQRSLCMPCSAVKPCIKRLILMTFCAKIRWNCIKSVYKEFWMMFSEH